tara:strand:+ start:11099 stop:11293 length:195 start_codon:yes stop_codon:yes gene_type:complete
VEYASAGLQIQRDGVSTLSSFFKTMKGRKDYLNFNCGALMLERAGSNVWLFRRAFFMLWNGWDV